ncbi:PSF2 [Symbiodinium sp. KB8]|nr:PSF2 [Symbiodinium sp. KB8]
MSDEAAKPFKKVADTVRKKRKTTLARFSGEGGSAIQECFLSVPPGAVAGEDFVAEISADECAIVTLPHGVGPGDLLQVKVCYSGQDTHLEVLQHIQRPALHSHNHRKLRTISSVAGCCAMLAVTIAILVPNWVAITDGANQEHIGLLAIQREGFTQTWSYIAKQCEAACLEGLPPDQLQYHQQRCRRDFRLRSLAWSSFLGLLLAMLVQIWAVLSVTAMRFWHAVALGLLSMTLHGWAVAHFLFEVGSIFPSYRLRWSMWFDVAGFTSQLTALLLVLVLRMRAQQSSRLLGLDFHFLEDVMLLREAQSPVVAWGNVSCFSETQPFDACCLAGLQLYDTTNRLCMSSCQPRSCFRQRSYTSCCQVARPLRVYGRRKAANQCFSGCGEPSWAEFLRVFRLSHGCVHCIGRHDLIQAADSVLKQSWVRGIEACRAGRIAAAFVVLVAAAVSRASTAPLAVHSAEAASLITGMMACDHTSLEWWQLLGVTDRQMQYVVAQMEPIPFLRSSINLPAYLGEAFNWSTASLDIGAGGFGDTLYMLARQMRVLAVDARPVTSEPWMMSHAWKAARKGHLEVLPRAVTAIGGATVPLFLDRHGQGLMSSLNTTIVPGVDLHALEEIQVQSSSCDELHRYWARGRSVTYMKVDVEGLDVECVRKLSSDIGMSHGAISKPEFFSIELPDSAAKVLELIEVLGGMGYTSFKICRQRLYNLRLARGPRYAASGPFGHDAVDFLRGPRWREASEFTMELLRLVNWERRRYLEWFDLHAAAIAAKRGHSIAEEQYEWDETDPGAGCPFLWRTYGFTPAGLFGTYKDRRFGWLRASFLYILSLPSHFLKTFDWNGIRRIWYGPKSEEDGVRKFGVKSMVVINYMLYRRSNIIMTVVFLGLFIAWSLEDFRSRSSAEELEKAVDLTSYEKFVMDKAATGENATFLSYSEEVMMQTFSAIQLQSAGLTTWKAIIKMLFLFMSMAYGFFAMRRWNYLRTSQYNLYFAWAAIITFPFLITFVPTSNLLDWTLSEKIFAHHLEEARRHFHTDEIVAACMLNDPAETFEVARPVIKAVCPVLQQRVPYVMPGVVRLPVLGRAVPVTISSWLPWLTNMVPEGTNLKPVHQICEKALIVTESNLTADLAATASDVCKSLATFLYKNVPAKATTALTELKEALREKQQESTEQAVYQLHFVDKVAGLNEVPLRLFSQNWNSRLDGILVRAGGDGTGCSLFSVPPSVEAEDAVVVVGPMERGRGSCSVRHILHLADKIDVLAVLILDPKRLVSRVPSPPRVTVGVVASALDSQAILHLLEKPETHSGVHVDIRYSPVFGLQPSARTPAGCLCKGLGYDSDCRVRPAELLSKSSAGRSPYPWCETAVFDYWGVPCKQDFDLCLPAGESEAFEKPDDECTTPCGRDGNAKHDLCYITGKLWLRSAQRCVAALGVAGKVERPDQEPEDFEGGMLNFAGAMNKLSVSGRLLTLSPAFDCHFRVTVEGSTGGHLPSGVDGHIRYSPTTETIGEWSSAGVNEQFIHCRLILRDPEITELHFQLDVKGNGVCQPRQFDAVRLEQQCRAHVSGSGQFSDWSLVPHGQLRTPTYEETGSNRRAQASRRLKDSSPSQDSDDDSSDDDGADSTRVKLPTCSEFVGVPCIDPTANLQTRCSDNQVCDSNYTTGGSFCRCADGFCWSYIKQACVDQSEHAREVVSKLLDETLLERHSPKLWATAKEVATVAFCAMEAAESLNNILRHVLAIGPGILISAWTAKLIFVQSTIPGYFSYFFTMVYSPAAWVLNNVWHQTADDWRLSLGLAAMAFWTIPVSVVGMKYGLHRPMSVARAMSLVNNLLLLYYFVLFAAVVFIVMFVFSDEPESEAYFSVSAAFRRKLRPGKLSKTELLYVLFGFLTESFAVFFITCCAATDAFIMVIVKEHQAAWSMLTRGKPLPAVQAVSQHADYAVVSQIGSTVCACTSAAAELPRQEMAPNKYTLDINGKDPLELLSDDTWEALCCEEITIVPALNTETDVDLISGKLGPLRAHTPLKVKLWAALQYASKHECQIELPHWLEASELETMCKEERAEPLKFSNVPRHYIEIAEALLAIPRAWGSESAREKSLLMLTKLIQIRRAKILEGIQAFDATMSTEFKVTGMSAAEITCFRTRSLAFLDTMLELLNYRLDESEKGGVAEAPVEEADDEDTLYAIEEQVTRDWLLLMKESSEEGQP